MAAKYKQKVTHKKKILFTATDRRHRGPGFRFANFADVAGFESQRHRGHFGTIAVPPEQVQLPFLHPI